MKPKHPRGFVAVLLVSALAVPAAAAFFGSQPGGQGANAAPPEETSTTAAAVALESVPLAAPPVSMVDDLARACGVDGNALVAAEAAGTLTPVQQAALDALRPICESEGTPLAAPSQATAPVQATVVQRQAAPASQQPTTTQAVNEFATASYPTAGGVVVIRYSVDQVFVDSASAAAGFHAKIEKNGPHRVEVKFEGNGEVKFLAFFENGELQLSIDEKVGEHHEDDDDGEDHGEDHEDGHEDDHHEEDD